MSAVSQIDPRLLEHLPTLPGTAVEFLRLCDDPCAGVRDVAAVAQSDPALMARILQVANSPFYAPREPVVDVARAAAILGLRSLKMIGVGFAILGDLWGSTAKSEQLSGIIGASTMAGSAARSFSARIGTGRDEEALTSGLLSYLGELALLRAEPDEFTALWDDAGGLPSVERQRDALPANGADLGVALMSYWHIPEDLRDGATARRLPLQDRLRRSPSVFDAAIGFGTAIADLLGAGQESAVEEIRPWARRWGLADSDLLGFWGEFRVAARRTVQQLGLNVGSELDAIIVGAREEYQQSQLAAMDQLEAAQRRIAELSAENERLEGLSLQDPLTGAPNRPAFEDRLRTALASLSRHPEEAGVGVAMFDLDHFKQVNDGEGHLVGDELLTAISRAALRAVREDELFARLGGDEFALVLRADSLEELEKGTERLRQAMLDAASTVGHGRATVSAGASLVQRFGTDILAAQDALVRAADDALYAAKRRGRNRTCVTAAMDVGLAVGAADA